MQARPYKLFGAAERALLQAAVEERVRAWSADWLGTAAAIGVECLPAPELAAREPGVRSAAWTTLTGEAEAWICVASGGDAVAVAWLGGGSAIVDEVARRSLRDLAASLLGSPAPRDSAGPQESAWGRGSAVLAAAVTSDGKSVHLLLSADWTARVLREGRTRTPAAAPLADMRDTIAGQPVDLRVQLGRTELPLRDLHRLSVGCVIALEARTDRPLDVELGGHDAPSLKARLGSVQGRRAAALVAVH